MRYALVFTLIAVVGFLFQGVKPKDQPSTDFPIIQFDTETVVAPEESRFCLICGEVCSCPVGFCECTAKRECITPVVNTVATAPLRYRQECTTDAYGNRSCRMVPVPVPDAVSTPASVQRHSGSSYRLFNGSFRNRLFNGRFRGIFCGRFGCR